MNYKLKKYEWVIYFLMVLLMVMMILLPITLLLAGTFSFQIYKAGTSEVFKDENIIRIARIIFGVMWTISWILIEALLIHLLKIIKRLRVNGVFIEKSKDSVEKMNKYLILFGIISVVLGFAEINTYSLNSVYRIEGIDNGVGLLTFSSIRSIEFSLYTVILIIIYILVKVLNLVLKEGLKEKQINNEIV